MTLNISTSSHSRDPQSSPTVREVQNLLIAKGYSVGQYGADGIFGASSEYATKRFQAHEGLARDGIIGPITYQRLKGSQPSRPATTEAKRFADLAYRLATTGIDGTRPAYVFGAEASMFDRSPDRLDCSELVQWAVTQVDGHTWVDGSRNQFMAGKRISVATAIATKGALLFITGNGYPSGIHHVAVSMGNGYTAEARSRYYVANEHTSGKAQQVGSWSAKGRFQFACKIPVLTY